jgi:hypothetical protein
LPRNNENVLNKRKSKSGSKRVIDNHIPNITSPATSERSDAAVNISDSLDDAPYEFEEEADEDEGDEALIRDFD